MKPIRPHIRRIFRLERWRATDAARDMEDEMDFHIAMRTEQLIANGMSPEDARTVAEQLFAQSHATLTELRQTALDRNRTMRMRDQVHSMMQDCRYALRRLTQEPATTAFILCTLALGIGVNLTAFSAVDRLLLRGPQHVRNADELVRFYSRSGTTPNELQTSPWLPYSAFETIRTRLQSADIVGAYRSGRAIVGAGVSSETRPVMMMSGEMFRLLGVTPALGRFPNSDDDANPVAVISDRYWKTALGSAPNVLGKTVVIDEMPYTIIGVAPAGFTGPELPRMDVWIPVSQAARTSMNVHIVARMKADIPLGAIANELELLREPIESSLPRFAQWLRGAEYLAAPLAYDSKARESVEATMARWLGIIAAIILVISCANVANLLAARIARRRRELAVRVALGSGRGRVVRLIAIEGMFLAIGATVLAFAVVAVVEPLLRGVLFPGGAWTFRFVDVRILGVAASMALITGVLVSILPALQAGRARVGDALRGGKGGGELRTPMRAGLTVIQAALSVVLLVGAGLFLRSMQKVDAVDLGMDADRVLAVEVRHAEIGRNRDESFSDFIVRRGAIERLRHRAFVDVARRVPGVQRASVSVGIPLDGSVTLSVFAPGRDSIPAMPGGGPYATAVGTDYFPTIGTMIRKGREFNDGDREGSEPVVIVSENMARNIWPGEEAIGKCITIHSREAACARVVGIAADLHRSGLREEPSMQFYVPIGQERGFSGSWLLLRPFGNPTTTWPELREALMKADPSIRSIDMRVLADGLSRELRPYRLGMMAFGLSAALAMIVAGLGLYSVMAHAVAWRRHEIGVRVALGARPQSIVALVVGRGALLAAVGIVIGCILAVAARQFVEPWLFETSATDPVVLLGVSLLLFSIALLAGWLPARHAVRINPTEALRAE